MTPPLKNRYLISPDDPRLAAPPDSSADVVERQEKAVEHEPGEIDPSQDAPSVAPPPEAESVNDGFIVGFALRATEGDAFDSEMLFRAYALATKVKPIADPDEKAATLAQMVFSLYPDMPHAWCAWETLAAFRANEPPHESVLFSPDDWDGFHEWLEDRMGQQWSLQFQVPLSFHEIPDPHVPEGNVIFPVDNLDDFVRAIDHE
jgi:hypothetical protein